MTNVGKQISASVILLLWVALLLPVLLRFDATHQIIASILALVLCGLVVRSRSGGIAATLVYLIVLGDYRRFAGFFGGYPSNDPLLLVAPFSAGCLFLSALIDNRIRGSTSLSLAISVFTFILVAEIFNPNQGSIAVGLAGALFYLVPMIWFWIGRAYGTPDLVLRIAHGIILPLAVAAALLGIFQSFRGLLPFEAAWVRTVRFDALYISEDVVRSFGFFTSSAEYTRFLLLASVITVCAYIHHKSRTILLLPVLLFALFLASSRGPIVMFTITTVILWAVSSRSPATWLPRFLLAGIAAVTLLTVLMLGLQKANLGGRIDVLVSHQVEGLLNPTNTEKSTAVGHVQLLVEGVLEGFKSPAGRGLGATTLAASKYGEGSYSAEMDVPNQFYSLGVLGGGLYLAIVIMILWNAVGHWRRRRNEIDLVLLGMLVAALSAWLLGGEYSIAALLWLAIGALDRTTVEVATKRREMLRNAYRLGNT